MTTWTKTPPSEPGWYWWRSDHGCHLCILHWEPRCDYASSFDLRNLNITSRDWKRMGEWFPVRIEPPKEQA